MGSTVDLRFLGNPNQMSTSTAHTKPRTNSAFAKRAKKQLDNCDFEGNEVLEGQGDSDGESEENGKFSDVDEEEEKQRKRATGKTT